MLWPLVLIIGFGGVDVFIPKIWVSDLPEYSVDTPSGKGMRLDRLNLLVGPNNSGKSRFLRSLFSTPMPALSIGFGEEYRSLMSDLGGTLDAMKNQPKADNKDWTALIDAYDDECVEVLKFKDKLQELYRVGRDAINPNVSMMGSAPQIWNEIRRANRREALNDALESLFEYAGGCDQFRRFYVPILRGMRPLEVGKDLYLERTIKDYFEGTKISAECIITGFNLYDLLVRNLLGQPADRIKIREYEKIIGDEFFGGAEVTLIPEYQKDTVSVKIGDDDQFPIFNLGDGLQQVIIITSVAFLEQDFSIFLIEEPENCLHPGLLRKLANFLLKHTEHQYLLTTHSNHLLDLAETHESVTIHRFRKIRGCNDSTFKISECTRDQGLLNELGARPSSVFLSNSTIWVEGITDRLYIRMFMGKYLEGLYGQELHGKYSGYLENLHYSFVEYQGGTLGHWYFGGDEVVEKLSASSVCATAFLIADGDIEGKSNRVELLRAQLSERFHLLACKELENLLPKEVIVSAAKNIFSRKHSKTTNGLNVDDIDSFLNKNIDTSKYGIGYHLDKCLGLPGRGKGRKVFADESGTISDKVKFCREVCLVMESSGWELSVQLKELCGKIFLHVSACQ